MPSVETTRQIRPVRNSLLLFFILAMSDALLSPMVASLSNHAAKCFLITIIIAPGISHGFNLIPYSPHTSLNTLKKLSPIIFCMSSSEYPRATNPLVSSTIRDMSSAPSLLVNICLPSHPQFDLRSG